MKIETLLWSDDRVEHIARHGVQAEEVEEVCFGRPRPLVLRARSEGKNPVFYTLGQTAAGRHLFCVVIQFSQKKGLPVTARDMTGAERQRFHRWQSR